MGSRVGGKIKGFASKFANPFSKAVSTVSRSSAGRAIGGLGRAAGRVCSAHPTACKYVSEGAIGFGVGSSSRLISNVFDGDPCTKPFDNVLSSGLINAAGSILGRIGQDNFVKHRYASRGRTQAKSSTEQRVMNTIKQDYTKARMIIPKLGDPKLQGWPWQKWHYSDNGVVVHFIRNKSTGDLADFKFKD